MTIFRVLALLGGIWFLVWAHKVCRHNYMESKKRPEGRVFE